MPIERYDHYGKPRLTVTDYGVFLIRDVLSEDGSFAGICENAVYNIYSGETEWRICSEGVEFLKIAPFLPKVDEK